jgi:hypothetical protein
VPGSTRLGPDESTQVVDFPFVGMAKLYWSGVENSRSLVRGMIVRGMTKRSLQPRWEKGVLGGVMRKVAGCKTERSLMFAYIRLKSLMFAYFEKKYFFPALWQLVARTQWVGVTKDAVGFQRDFGGGWAHIG